MSEARMNSIYTCHTSVRTTRTPAEVTEVTVTPSLDGNTIENGDFFLEAKWTPPGFIPGNVQITAGLRAPKTPMVTQLYPHYNPRDLEGNFHGGYGFTGLATVHHPEGTSEMQFWCTSKE
ncbi:MAG: hypothetical protein R3C68_11780 [Myxococcota bacterium]